MSINNITTGLYAASRIRELANKAASKLISNRVDLKKNEVFAIITKYSIRPITASAWYAKVRENAEGRKVKLSAATGGFFRDTAYLPGAALTGNVAAANKEISAKLDDLYEAVDKKANLIRETGDALADKLAMGADNADFKAALAQLNKVIAAQS